jgi:pimeloyl-ACP methyl ester carboxylesterase
MRQLLLILVLLLVVMPVAAQQESFDPTQYADEGGFFVEVDGVETYVWQRGPEDGQPVLLLHGFMGSAFDWRENIDALAASGFRVTAFDRPPFGLSAKVLDRDYSPANQADFVGAVMDVLGIEEAAVVGHSLGGRVAAQFTLRHPERVTKLVIVAGAIGTGEGSAVSPALERLLNVPGLQRLLFNAVDDIVEDVFADYDENLTAEERERLRAQFQFPNWGDALLEFADDSSDREQIVPADLAVIDVPILLLWGADDMIVPLSVGQDLHAVLPDARWKIYPDVGHLPMQEAPMQFNLDIAAFLAS